MGAGAGSPSNSRGNLNGLCPTQSQRAQEGLEAGRLFRLGGAHRLPSLSSVTLLQGFWEKCHSIGLGPPSAPSSSVPCQLGLPSPGHTFLGSGPASAFLPHGAHTPVSSVSFPRAPIPADICTETSPGPIHGPARAAPKPRVGGEGPFISPRFQAVCRTPCRRQPAGLQATTAPPPSGLGFVKKALFLRGKGGTKLGRLPGGWYVDVPEPGVFSSPVQEVFISLLSSKGPRFRLWAGMTSRNQSLEGM